jgi:hypothetical protein
MSTSNAAVVTFLCICFLHPGKTGALTITRNAKPIQVDGYLIEWPEPDVDTSDMTFSYVWDAANTSAGLAGYVKYPLRDSCGVSIQLYPNTRTILTLSAGMSDSMICAVDTVVFHGDTSIILEWVVPWRVLTYDTSGRYAITIGAVSSCSDARQRFLLSGTRYRQIQGKSLLNRKIVIQSISILFLLSAFIILQVRARKLYKKR